MVQPHQRLIGEQLAGWRPKKTSAPTYQVECSPDIAIPLPDGTVLRGDLYSPRADGIFPVLLAWSSYTRALQNTGLPLPINEIGVTRIIVSRGYCHLIVNARGTGHSEGKRVASFSPLEQQDVYDTIEWTAQQPWCDGNIGMVGMSYFAAIQYLAAAKQPPHLKAIFPYLGFTDLYRHVVYHGGAFQSDFFATYYTFVGSTQKLSVKPAIRHILGYLFDRGFLQAFIMRLFFLNRTKMPGRLHPQESWMRDFAQLAFDQRFDGPFYHEKSAWPVLSQIAIPTCIGTNWGNPGLHMKGAFQAWAGISSEKKVLFIGPPDPHWPWQNYQEEMLAWYDFYLKGIDTGIEEQPPVRYWLQGADKWKTAQDWPLPGAVKQRFYLTAITADALAEQRLQAEPSASEVSLSFVAIPRNMLYPKVLKQYEAQVLRYITEPFQEATEITGPLRLSLELASTAIDTHIIARISDLAPDGRRRNLAFGWLEASHRKVSKELSRPDEVIHEHQYAEPLHPGETVTLELSLTPMANLFKEGHRLLLEIGSQPELLGTNAFEGFIFFPYAAPSYPARNTLFHGGSNESWIEWEVCKN